MLAAETGWKKSLLQTNTNAPTAL